MTPTPVATPYCGPSPLPSELWLRWNLDPLLLIVLGAVIALHAMRLRVLTPASSPAQRGCFAAGWLLTILSFVSPLCALGVALFSARVSQHMWLALIAAPLLALAHRPAMARAASLRSVLPGPLGAAGLFAIALWAWHLPTAYEASLRSSLMYWLMHVSIGGTALMLWSTILDGARHDALTRIGAGFATVVHMGLLGALIALAPRLLYRAHVATAPPWGLDPIEDQQLGGFIMWVPAGVLLVVAVLAIVYAMLRPRGAQIDRV
jgi:putative membrane protein